MPFSKRQREIKDNIQSIFITSPCSVKFEQLTGDERVKYCGDCKLNVYNLSQMSDKEVVSLFSQKQENNERICVSILRKNNGKLITDNCPKQLKQLRNRLKICAAFFVLAFCYCWGIDAIAQGLVDATGAPVNPEYGQSGGASALAECGSELGEISQLTRYINTFLALLCGITFGLLGSRNNNR